MLLETRSRPARGNHQTLGQIGEHRPPVPLDSHADSHTKVYFLITINEGINEGIASELLARNRWRILVQMARVACMHVTIPADGRKKSVQYR